MVPCRKIIERGYESQLRIAGRSEHDALKGPPVHVPEKSGKLSDKQEKALDEMVKLYPTLGEAYRLKVLFNDLWAMPDKKAADAFLGQWCAEVETDKIHAFLKSVKTGRAHYWSRIVHFVESHITNDILEGINNKSS